MDAIQTFEATTSPDQGPPRLAALRGAMAEAGLAGMLTPRADAWQGENVAPCDERLAWLTGFTGSAGFCAVLTDRAGIFIDGRYRVQVRQQVDPVFTPVHWPETGLADWLKEHCAPGAKIGFDPWLHTVREMRALRRDAPGIEFVATPHPIDGLWHDRPARPTAPAVPHPIEMSGQRSPDKRAACAEELEAAGVAQAVITLPDSICWLLNIRGADIPRTPTVQAFAVLHATGK
ncbi:MAG: aminopeptidase P family N-terminal domain-containing protein, partial [Pseudomonadota bacterium]